jgi:hypothetical protein
MKGKLIDELHQIMTEPVNIFSGALLIVILINLLVN